MITVKRILCPIDFSEFADRALRHAVRIARWYDAEIHAVHVVPLMAEGWAVPLAVGAAHPGPATPSGLREALDARLEPARAAGSSLYTEVREGGAVREILAYADEAQVDLIVMGSHGRRGFQRLLLGSVTDAVLRRAKCPVVTVCHGGEPTSTEGSPFQRILCAVDFQPASERALRFALDLAGEADAEITLLHVLEPFFEEEISKRTHISVESYRKFLETQLLARLGTFLPAEAADACRPHEVVRIGWPWEEITRVARESSAELVVMGLHGGRGAIDRLVFGSTAQQVLRHAECPVLTIGEACLAQASHDLATAATASGDGRR
jgi:nucleotide-binding universal stress UspA family protein